MRPLLNRALTLPLLLLFVFLVSGCTANVANTDESGLIPHLTVDFQLPANIELNKVTTLSLAVQQSDQPFEHAEEATFKIWLEDSPEEAITLPATERKAGVYEVDHTFTTEGLYVIQGHVLSSAMEVMPAKRLAIGSVALEQLAQLNQHQPDIAVAPVGHSHH